MRTFVLCAAAICLGAFLAAQVESRASPDDIVAEASVHPFEDATIAETEFYEEEGENAAKAFPQCGFQGQPRNTGTPMVINGHNNVASLKVPAGQCVSIFTKAGYNDGTEGEMLSIRGPMNVACLAGVKTRDGQSNWLASAQSYKMGPCTAKPTEDMATAAVKTAAASADDLSELSHKAVAAAQGEFGSMMSSFTKSDNQDGIAYPYDQHKIAFATDKMEGVATGMTVMAGSKMAVHEEEAPAEGSAAPVPAQYPYHEHAAVEENEAVEKPNTEAEEESDPDSPHVCEGICDAAGPGVCVSEQDAVKPACAACAECHKNAAVSHAVLSAEKLAAGSALGSFEDHYEQNKGDEKWKKLHIPFPKLPHTKPFRRGNSPGDDLEDLKHVKNKLGCDPNLGCREPAPPCADKDTLEICEDYLANGDCQFDFVQKNCQLTCDLCPKPEGSISDDAYTGPGGHYYIGGARRRIGAGFGRRRRSPAPPPAPVTGSAVGSAVVGESHVVKVPVDILHPTGEEVVPGKLVPKVDCDACLTQFQNVNGCKVWKDGNDASALVPDGCMVCAKSMATACGVTKPIEGDNALPKPIEHPNQAAAQEAQVSEEEKAHIEKHDVPKAVAEAAEKAEQMVKGAPPPPPVEAPVHLVAEGSAKPPAPQAAEAEAAAAAANANVVTKAAVESNEEAANSEAKAVSAEAKVTDAKTPAAVAVAKEEAHIAEKAAQGKEAQATNEQASADNAQASAENAEHVAENAEEATPVPVDEHLAGYTEHTGMWCAEKPIAEAKATPLDACADACKSNAACANFGIQGTTCVMMPDCEPVETKGATLYNEDIKNMPKPEDQVIDEESKDWAAEKMKEAESEIGEVSGGATGSA